MENEENKAPKEDKLLKWEIPKLHYFKFARTAGTCTDGSGDAAGCGTGTSALANCLSGNSPGGYCSVGTGGDIPPPL